MVKRVRDLCIFARQNLCNDPPFSRMDLISCRNVLIYFGAALQRQILPVFHYALRPGGFLLLGVSETIREFTDLFTLRDRRSKIFSRIDNSLSQPFLETVPQISGPNTLSPGDQHEVAENWNDIELQRAADRIVLGRYAPPGVVINERMDILQSRGQTTAYLEIPPGPARFNLARMVRQEIAHQVMEAVRRAIESGTPVQSELIHVQDINETRRTTLEVLPIHTINGRPGCYLVLFVSSQQPL